MSNGKVAVVTGAASGIGAATARRLARAGYSTWLADRQVESTARVADEIRAEGGHAETVSVDVADRSSVEVAFADILRRSSAIDVLVNSAGVTRVSEFTEISDDDWNTTFRVNVVGTYLCLCAALPGLRAAEPPARVVNISSTAGKTPSPLSAAYAASKAAIISLTRSAAVALAPDVLVNTLCPGIVDTPMWTYIADTLATLPATGEPAATGGVRTLAPGTTFAQRGAELPIRRGGTAEEIAEVVALLVGPAGAYILGEDLNVNGGLALY